jgi:hypothetical protein
VTTSRGFDRISAAKYLSLVALLLLSGCGKGKSVPGLNSFHVGVLQSRLYASFVSTTLHWDVGLTAPIPGLQDSSVSVSPDLASSGTVFQFSIPLGSLLNHGRPLPIEALPDGRPLPDIQGGELPRWDTEINGLKLSVYLSNDAFALFVPLNFVAKNGFTLATQVSVSIEDERGNLLGKAYAIPVNVSGSGSGLFVLLPYLGGSGTQTGSMP